MKKIFKNIVKTILFHVIFPLMYRFESRKPIKDGYVLFIEIRYGQLSDNFTLLYEEFRKKEGFVTDTSFLGNSCFSYGQYFKACMRMIPKLAVAKYVFVNESSNVLAALPIRKETRIVQTWHGCGAFKRFGYGGGHELKEKYYNDYFFTTVSSPCVVDIYSKSMRQKKDRVIPIGVSRTDVFFDKQYIDTCKNDIKKRYNIGGDKKIVLYAPTFRGNVGQAESPKLLDISMMYKGLGEEYVIIYKGHPAVSINIDIPDDCKQFFVDASVEKIEALMCASDMCVTDYSSLVFEYALLDKPMFFYAYDYKEYVTERGFYYSYEEFVPGGIYYNEEELIKGIVRDGDESCKKVKSFREKFMSSCDGHSTERIINRLLDFDF